MRKFIWQLIIGVGGLWLAQALVPEVRFEGTGETLILCGLILGLINFFIKPVLELITLPLRILFLGIVSLAINMVIIWVVDVLFTELVIPGLIPLFWTALILWGVDFLLSTFFHRRASS